MDLRYISDNEVIDYNWTGNHKMEYNTFQIYSMGSLYCSIIKQV